MHGAEFPLCLLFGLRRPRTVAHLALWWGYLRTLGGLMLRRTSQNFCCQCPCPHGETQSPPASAGDPLKLAGRSAQSPMGSLLLPLGPDVHTTVCVLQEWSLCCDSTSLSGVETLRLSGVSQTLCPVKLRCFVVLEIL